MNFDVLVIGAGPGGYVCAIRAAQLGFKTAIVEKYPTLGGTCLNVGCIPSKALLAASENFHKAQHSFADFGVVIPEVRLDLEKMMAHKSKVVSSLTSGIAGLMKKNQIQSFQGHGRLLGGGNVQVGDLVLHANHIVLATGSKPIELPFLKFDDDRIVSSTGALSFPSVPQHLLVIGGGVIGLELGSVWLRLGAKVTVVEFLDRILPPMDRAISREMKKLLTRQGMQFHLDTGVTAAERVGDLVRLTAKEKSGQELHFDADRVLVAVGRKPFTSGLGLEEAGVVLDSRGRIQIDAHWRTSAAGIYAIGDVVPGAMLAHKAEDEGIALAEHLAGKHGHLNPDAIPNIVYTSPEVGAVGKTEEELKEAGIPYRVGIAPFKANARARCVGESDGFVKILAHKDSDRLLGCHILGPNASELIQEAVAVIEFMGSAEDLARTVHGHPTLFESVREAALAVDGRAIHF